MYVLNNKIICLTSVLNEFDGNKWFFYMFYSFLCLFVFVFYFYCFCLFGFFCGCGHRIIQSLLYLIRSELFYKTIFFILLDRSFIKFEILDIFCIYWIQPYLFVCVLSFFFYDALIMLLMLLCYCCLFMYDIYCILLSLYSLSTL